MEKDELKINIGFREHCAAIQQNLNGIVQIAWDWSNHTAKKEAS
ncbi:hypothetical protein [Desulfogranum marinum]|nr:hypothetical protein [Desulfogranum marinum]